MKKTFTILIALMVLCFTQCKPTPEGGDANGSKVKVSCVIPINDGGKSDFTNLMEDGKVNWSDGLERVYVAIPGATPKIIELVSQSDGNHPKLEFEGEAAEGLITDGAEYEVWYFGHSKQLSVPYYSLEDENKITGSIAEQSGRLEDLGLCHIAKTTVTAEAVEGEVVLNLNGILRHQVAIALLDLENVEELYGDAIIGTEYTLAYNGEKFELNVTEDNNAKIEVESGVGISYVALFPNSNKEAKIKHKQGDKTYAYSFYNGVKANKIYFRMNSDGVTAEALTWEEIEEEEPEQPSEPDQPGDSNDHEYVDLGLSVKWATCNVGATSPEEYGNYYAWGETTTKTDYSSSTSATYGLSYSSLQSQGYIDNNGNLTLTAQHDAATANWGGDWRMPTYEEQEELLNNCTWTWTTQNGVNGYKVSSKVNSNYIFLPAAGCRLWSALIYAGSEGSYWSSTPDGDGYNAYSLYFDSSGQYMNYASSRGGGQSVRPVCGGNYVEPVLATISTNEVTEITSNSAVLGGNVTTDNGSTVTAKGVCWSESPNPTIEDSSITVNGNGIGSFTSNITDLDPNTQYYVRAYATNAAGTSYGEEKTFTTLSAGPDANDHSYVDLGLSVKWATCNVGATSPEEYGNYYAWGETTTKTDYSSSTSATYGLSYSSLQSQGYIDNGNLTAQHDAATANWGGDWRMPTYEEQEELLYNCTWTWTTQNGVNGYKVTSKTNGNYIFLPAAGCRDGSSLYGAGSRGDYWSSTFSGIYGGYDAYCLFFYSSLRDMGYDIRFVGLSVRPVIE